MIIVLSFLSFFSSGVSLFYSIAPKRYFLQIAGHCFLEYGGGLFQSGQCRHSQILHLLADRAVIALHAQAGQEFLPPADIMAVTECNIVPCALCKLVDGLSVEYAVRTDIVAFETKEQLDRALAEFEKR